MEKRNIRVEKKVFVKKKCVRNVQFYLVVEIQVDRLTSALLRKWFHTHRIKYYISSKVRLIYQSVLPTIPFQFALIVKLSSLTFGNPVFWLWHLKIFLWNLKSDRQTLCLPTCTHRNCNMIMMTQKLYFWKKNVL